MRRHLIALFAATAAFVAAAPALPASAGTASDFVAASPAPGSSLSPKGPWYLLESAPGRQVHQTIRVRNPNDHAVDAHLAGVDAVTLAATGASFTSPTKAPSAVGRWIVPDTTSVHLAPHASQDVGFTVDIGSAVTAGEYLGGLSAYVPLPKAPPTKAAGSFQVELNVQSQAVVAVEIHVPGPAAPNLVVRGAHADARSNGVVLAVDIANTGNAFARGTGEITIDGVKHPFKIDTFVSDTSISYGLEWLRTAVPGKHQVTVRLDAGPKPVLWSGTVAITSKVTDRVNQLRPHGTSDAPQTHSTSSSGSSVLYVLGGFILVVLVGGAVTIWVSSRRRMRLRTARRRTRRLMREPMQFVDESAKDAA
jgi:hypothetical protein